MVMLLFLGVLFLSDLKVSVASYFDIVSLMERCAAGEVYANLLPQNTLILSWDSDPFVCMPMIGVELWSQRALIVPQGDSSTAH